MEKRNVRLLLLAATREEEIEKIAALSKEPEKVRTLCESEDVKKADVVDWVFLGEDAELKKESEHKEIKITACDELKAYMNENGLESIVMRETRGIMDGGNKKLNQDKLGVCGVDGIIIMCSSTPFSSSALEEHKGTYYKLFSQTPVFFETRLDSLWTFYKGERDKTEGFNVEEYLKRVKNKEYMIFEDIENTHIRNAKNLLWRINNGNNLLYEVDFYNRVIGCDEDIYVTPISVSYVKSDEYAFFQKVTLENLKDNITKILEGKKLLDEIEKDESIKKQYLKHLNEFLEKTKEEQPYEYWFYRQSSADQDAICNDILNGKSFLGVRGGIKGIDIYGKMKYRTALGCARTAEQLMFLAVNEFKPIDEKTGEAVEKNKCELVKIYIRRIIFENRDRNASWRGYCIIDRKITERGIYEVQKEHGSKKMPEDILNEVVCKIAEEIFCQKNI